MSHALDMLKRYYDLTPRGIIHVGANKGQEIEAYKLSGARPVVLVEPLADPFRRLVHAINGEPGFHPVQACLSAKSGRRVDFHIASNGGQSSSYLKPGTHLQFHPRVKFDETIRIETSTLDDTIGELGLNPEGVDYLALDTQGSEKDVLLGARKTLLHIKFAWLEVNFGGLYVGDTGLYTMIEFMRGQGFDLYYLLMRRQSWGDALFIRRGVVNPN